MPCARSPSCGLAPVCSLPGRGHMSQVGLGSFLKGERKASWDDFLFSTRLRDRAWRCHTALLPLMEHSKKCGGTPIPVSFWRETLTIAPILMERPLGPGSSCCLQVSCGDGASIWVGLSEAQTCVPSCMSPPTFSSALELQLRAAVGLSTSLSAWSDLGRY